MILQGLGCSLSPIGYLAMLYMIILFFCSVVGVAIVGNMCTDSVVPLLALLGICQWSQLSCNAHQRVAEGLMVSAKQFGTSQGGAPGGGP